MNIGNHEFSYQELSDESADPPLDALELLDLLVTGSDPAEAVQIARRVVAGLHCSCGLELGHGLCNICDNDD